MLHLAGMARPGLAAFMAVHLAKQHPVTLLFKHQKYVRVFNDNHNTISVTDGSTRQTAKIGAQSFSAQNEISSLIVTCAGPDTIKALEPLAHRLGPASNVLVLYSGIDFSGAIEHLWPQKFHRPLVTYGLSSIEVASSTHSFDYNVNVQGSILYAGARSSVVSAIESSCLQGFCEQVSWPEFCAEHYQRLVLDACAVPLRLLTSPTDHGPGPGPPASSADFERALRGLIIEACEVVLQEVQLTESSAVAAAVAGALDIDRLQRLVLGGLVPARSETGPAAANMATGHFTRLARRGEALPTRHLLLFRLMGLRSQLNKLKS